MWSGRVCYLPSFHQGSIVAFRCNRNQDGGLSFFSKAIPPGIETPGYFYKAA
jgi:hypothetical protein